MSDFYSKPDIDKVEQTARIDDFVPGERIVKNRRNITVCPQCRKKSLQIVDNRQFRGIKCFDCGFVKTGVFSVVMHYESCTYPEAIKLVADRYGISVESEKERRTRLLREQTKSMSDSFLMKQLTGSGLTLEDISARVRTKDGKDWQTIQLFVKGTMDARGNIESFGDDMLIRYYNLEGMPMKVATRGVAGGQKDYTRARWQLPEAHRSGKDGKPGKYGAIKGAEAKFFFPGRIIQAYQDKEQFDTLVIQEGEKKAVKACKHGIMSIAIQGIYNIGNKNQGLISDLQYLVRRCGIKRIALLFDSDWDNLSRSISNGDEIDARPRQFANAAIKFRDYVDTLNNLDLDVNIWFGHINDNEAGDKGIDDLLCNTLKDREEILWPDILAAMSDPKGVANYVSMHKISVMSDAKILNFWDLRDKDAFFRRHADRIKDLRKFRFAKINYVVDDSGAIERSSSFGEAKDFWTAYFDDEKKEYIVKFDPSSASDFLQNNGFRRYTSPELGNLKFGFVRIENGVAYKCAEYQIRDTAFEYLSVSNKIKAVKNYFLMQLPKCIGPNLLERLQLENIENVVNPDEQIRFFRNGQIRITDRDITLSPNSRIVWEEEICPRLFKRIPVISEIAKLDDGAFIVKTTPEGDRCEFLQFLVNTSNDFRDRDPGSLTDEERRSIYINLVNKITAIGYLITDYRYNTEEKVIVAMDSSMSEVGKSQGRTGKSLIGKAIEQVTCQAFVDGKELNGSDDFMFSDVTPQARNVFFDDVKPNFCFTRLFAAVTGPLMVNPKLGSRFKIEYEKVPKFYVTTNHAISDDSRSAKDRMVLMMFSNWYNDDYKPIDEFGHTFFSGWNDEQWQLFDNLMAECVMFYFRSMQEGWSRVGCGVVHPPMRQADLRQMRQKMGEAFLQWAEAFFSPDSGNLSRKLWTKDIMAAFIEENPLQAKFVSATVLREKIETFCRFKGYHFNPHRLEKKSRLSFQEWHAINEGSFIGDREASNSKTYITVCTDEQARELFNL
ncbi:MAG: DUF3854 domain-containing protein [Muribaculaceae bacterium]|nr:DUF3854 domain-containing protein [Muribaculaceae bacterium]